MSAPVHRPSLRWSLVLLVALATLIAPLAASVPSQADPSPSAPTERRATLVGSLQDELGCSADWQPSCTQTQLAQKPGTTSYLGTFTVPAGDFEYKIAINRSWDEAYGGDGGKDNTPLVLQGPAEFRIRYDDQTHKTSWEPTKLPGSTITPADRALASPALRNALTRERFYFLMADRFANGDTANDRGGLTGGRLQTGFDPADKGFYHGGDLLGVLDKLAYIKGLGTTAIWLTPSFKNRPVQGSGDDVSAGYHGYWITDFTRIDPHLGSNADMQKLIKAAHALGMKVFFDIITNHTADIIKYKGGKYSYISKEAVPYKDAHGLVFDDRDYAGGSTFPKLDPKISFPYQPIFADQADVNVKVPAWLNDRTVYHNRGNTTYEGENALYGDFAGLDDLFTEQPKVVKGMEDIYKSWADLGIDGFRIDTMKHVNTEFWSQFSPNLLKHASEQGKKDFFMFGEVYDANPAVMSAYTTAGKVQATLDFGFQDAALGLASSKAPSQLRDFYTGDDYYTDTDSNAYQLPTFLGNHDMGRISMMLVKAGYTGDELARRVRLANDLMFLTRGQPVTYYGDEQGFIGKGGDKDARQDMFATKTAQYKDEANLYGAGAKDRYDTSTPLYRRIAKLSKLRATNPALADGAQIPRYAAPGAGIFAISRFNPADKIEYIVAVNNASEPKTADFETFSDRMRFSPLLGSNKLDNAQAVRSRADGRVSVTVPPLSVAVWKADRRADRPAAAPRVIADQPGNGAAFSGRAEIAASLSSDNYSQVSFGYRPAGTTSWQPLGTDDNVPYRVFHDVTGLKKGTAVEYRVVARDTAGHLAATSTFGIVGTKGTAPQQPGPGTGPVKQPDAVSVPGSHNVAMGCPGDWQPDCAQAQLTLDHNDDIWKKSYTIPAGGYAYKAAINKSWDENYGKGGAAGGSNIEYHTPAGPVSFYYEHRTHIAQSTAEGPVITATGSYQSEQGCSTDWAPDCMRTWLTDRDGDGTYSWTGVDIPKGDYQLKVAHNLSMNESYGKDGGRDNLSFTVPADQSTVMITYNLSTHVPSVLTSEASGADLAKAKAYWVNDRLLAWPADAIPAGTDPAALRWRLHAQPGGGMTVDSERVNSARTFNLAYDPAGLGKSVLAKHPQLKKYLAISFPAGSTRLAKKLLKDQLAVGLYDDQHQIINATGVQIPMVLDSLYANSPHAKATRQTYGIDWGRRGHRPEVRVWAPTATGVSMLVWPAGTAGDAPVSQARRHRLNEHADGSWSGHLPDVRSGSRYLYEVKVYQPATGKVETNRVTDPYSVALTLNSTRSVAINLADKAFMPKVWRKSAQPKLRKDVDNTIYELHVRDFSISDPTVPKAHRGSYLAFADRGNGTKHLRTLQRAGLTTVHLLPTFDIATIEEDPAKQQTPPCDLASYPPDSQLQQECIGKVADSDAFNWGYDPFHWMAPEGSYASSAANADGGRRIAEFRTMVGSLHADGLRVVLDQVFNHTAASGQDPKSVLDKIVPGYYHRLDASGAILTSTCCPNIATEHAMAQKIMVDAVVLWARDYKVDGFRFDLMGFHSRPNMLAVRHALDRLTPARDGVNGKAVYLYGEGWNFGEVADNALFTQASQGNLGGTGIGTFSDRSRDAVRGGSPFDDDPRKQGFGDGLLTDPNALDQPDAAKRLDTYTDLIQLGLAGNLRDFTFTSTEGKQVRGDQIDYNGSPAGYADQPDEVISYVDAHDNETLFDELAYKLPTATTMADRVRMNTLSLSIPALGQSPAFWHAGTDLLRSKSLDRNSYNSGDWFNRLDWTGKDNGFGHGLPPKADNQDKWKYQQPLLADPKLKPDRHDVQAATAQAQQLLELRFSSPLFRLGSAKLIKQKVSFPASGTADAHDGVIAMRIDDTLGRRVDPRFKSLMVVFNATPAAVTQKVPTMAGTMLTLSKVQARGTDPVVKRSAWNASTGTLTVPARTVAVFTEPR